MTQLQELIAEEFATTGGMPANLKQKHIVCRSHLYDDSATLQINSDMYEVTKMPLDEASCVCQAVRLVKANMYGMDGDPVTYDVSVLPAGYYECTCADHIYRSGPAGRLCKHIQACLDNKLIRQPGAWSESEMAERFEMERADQYSSDFELAAVGNDADIPF